MQCAGELLNNGTTMESTRMYIYSSGLFDFALDYYVGTGSYAYLDVRVSARTVADGPDGTRPPICE